ncbi:hypothetical protein NLU13_8631 [Sarocladium strictum]|uniref:Phosphoglycerate mutase family protein n=1 Tax=Sarocladium strictum TaxID=5046 RepID=A0AA39L5B9_SARSR|nr:hypothetical protein NLU13_8631 [Sarocladium strictum]
MAPTIHLMRHAQGYHNLCVENEQLPDPDLTPLGLHQCAELRASFPYHGRVRRVISSPLRRTLHTSINVLGRDDLLFPILPLETLQEVSISPCDTGSNIEVLRSEFGDKVDFQNLSPHWEDKSQTGPNQPDLLKLEERARKARQAIRELADPESDDHLVVVTHGDFLHFLTEDWDGVPELDFYVWKNCEFRSYQFENAEDAGGNCTLVETAESWNRRRGSAERPTTSQQDDWRTLVYARLRPVYAGMAR